MELVMRIITAESGCQLGGGEGENRGRLRTVDESSETEEGHCRGGGGGLGWVLVLWREREVVGVERRRSCQIDVS